MKEYQVLKEYNFVKRFQRKDLHKHKGSIMSSVVLRSSFSKNHNDLENLFNFSLWFGMPQHDRISFEIFIYKTKDMFFPRIQLKNWNKVEELD